MLNSTDQFTFHSRIPTNPIDSDYRENIFHRLGNGAIARPCNPAIIHVECATRDELNDTRRRQMEMTRLARSVPRRWTVASSRQTLRSKNLETRWATGLNSRYRERKHRLSSCLYLSVPFSLSPLRFPSPLPLRIFLHLCSLRACPVAFLFRGQILPLTFYDSAGRLGATIARETLLLAEHICRNNCYDYRAEISFMNLDFFYVSVLVYIGWKGIFDRYGNGFHGRWIIAGLPLSVSFIEVGTIRRSPT